MFVPFVVIKKYGEGYHFESGQGMQRELRIHIYGIQKHEYLPKLLAIELAINIV